MAFHREAGHIFFIAVWPDVTQGVDEYGTRDGGDGRQIDARPWERHCPVPARRAMKMVGGVEVVDDLVEKRATIVALPEAMATRFRDNLVTTGKVQVYETRFEASLAHPELDFDKMGKIYGVPV